MTERQKPGPLTTKEFFNWVTASIKVSLEQQERLGEAIRDSVGGLVKNLKARGIKLPDAIDIESKPWDIIGGTTLLVSTYNPKDNSLTWVLRQVAKTEPFSRISDEDPSIRLVPIPIEEIKDEAMGKFSNEEWLTHGLQVVEKLQEVTAANTVNGKE